MALAQRGKVCGVILHSDRGSPYCSREYQNLRKANGIRYSISGPSDCWDNTPMESFYHSLNPEWVAFSDYLNLDQARAEVFSCIELFYNPKRRHSTLDYVSPVAYEATAHMN